MPAKDRITEYIELLAYDRKQTLVDDFAARAITAGVR